mgnify:FL=1
MIFLLSFFFHGVLLHFYAGGLFKKKSNMNNAKEIINELQNAKKIYHPNSSAYRKAQAEYRRKARLYNAAEKKQVLKIIT